MSSSSSFFSGTNPTPTEYQTAVDLVAQATQKANSAIASANSSDASAQSSQGYSVAAGNSATSAANQAASAATSATNASSSATAASTSATNAASSATTASTQASNAATQATNASNSASAAATSATAAATSATNAASSATAAATSASNAAATLSGAMVKASNLSDVASVSTARTNLGVAIGSNVQAWDADLDAIAAISGTNGLLRKTAANTWSLDTTSYLSGTVAVANGGTGGTTSTGSGSVVLANSPTLVTPALGTPSSGNLANCTFPTLNQNTTGTAANVTGTVAVANGGTGLNSLTAGYIPFGNGTGALNSSASFYINPAGNVLTLTGLTSFAPQIICWNQAVDNTASYVILRKSRGGSGAGAATVAGDVLGTYLFSGFDSGGVATNSSYLMATASAIGSGNVDSAVSLVAVGSTSSLRFGTNSSERMRIDSVGNVGIGTSSPSANARLSISGAVNINGGTPVALATTSLWNNGDVSIPPNGGYMFNAYYTNAWKAWQTGYSGSFKHETSGSFVLYSTASSSSADASITLIERLRIDNAGRVGINGAAGTNTQLNVTQLATGQTAMYNIYAPQTAYSDVTAGAYNITSAFFTQPLAFTLGANYHFFANQGTIGNSSIVTSQFGFLANSSLVGATNNYGFYSSIAANPGPQTLSAATISTIASSGTTTTVVTTAAHGLASTQVVTVAATANATALVSGVTCTILTVGTTDFTLIGAASNTVGVSFTATGAGTGTGTVRINQQGSGKAVTVVDTTTFTYTSTTGTYAAITASGSVTPNTRFNIYVGGTAPSYFSTSVGIGTTTPRGRFEIANTSSSGMAITATSAATDEKTWDFLVGGTNFAIRTLNDVYSAASNAYIASRSGNLVTTHTWYTSNAERMRIDSVGNVGIGATTVAGFSLILGKNITGGTSSIALRNQGTVLSDVTSLVRMYDSFPSFQSATYSISNLQHYYAAQNTLPGTVTVTNQYGFFADATLTGATNDYGFYGNIPSGTGRWNFYAAGTADNLFSGNVLIFGAGGLGYGTGSGGAVTQATSRTTGVTLNKTNGAITLVSAAGSATYQTFTVTNSTVAATDTIIVNQKSGTDKYIILVTAVAAGSFAITFATTGGTTTEQPVFNFAVIKAVTA